jgi:dihydrofolate reductase
MRKVIGGPFITLDGVIEAPYEWQFDHFDADMEALMGKLLERADTVLLGRNTYEEWSPYWPTATDEPFASWINNAPKYVVSTTLNDVSWGTFNNITLIKDNITETIGKLKQQPGKDIAMPGSTMLLRTMLYADLVDELTLTIHPVLAGKGKRLFQEGDMLKRLKLIDSQISQTGVAMLTYEPLRSA